MRILWAMLNPGSVRNFESTLRCLAERGHQVHVQFGARAKLNEEPMLDRIAGDCPAIVFDYAPHQAERDWSLFASTLRCYVDYLPYLHPRYAAAPRLRARAGESVAPLFRTCVHLPGVRRLAGLGAVTRALIGLERVVPRVGEIEALLERERPDLVLVSPLVDIGSAQVDYVKSARAHGIPVGLCVTSWDNLSNKGRIRPIPDLVAVWNEAQKREAVDFHGVPSERVAVTGAPAYDHWFDWKPRAGPDDFRARVGLPVGRPFVLYLGSSSFIAPDETSFVRRWLGAIRSAHDPALRSVGVLVRPHPQNAGQWRDVEFGRADGVAIWPRAGANPVDEASRADYFDSMYHCAAVVGVNTSGLIESAILGRPVFTVVGSFAETQEGTLHFHHLLTVNGGLLHVARDLDEHGRQLAAALAADGHVEDEKSRAFVAAFVRPHGRHVPSTPLLVEAIDTLGGSPRPKPAESTLWTRALRAAMGPAVRGLGRAWRRRQRRLKREAERAGKRAADPAERDGTPLAEDAWPAAEAARWRAEAAVAVPRTGASPEPGSADPPWTAAAFRRHLEALASSRAYRTYQAVREHVLAMKEHHQDRDATDGPSAYWREELSGFDYILDASPLVVAKLRHHAHHITGIRPYQYRSRRVPSAFRDKLDWLVAAGGRDLLVPESRQLGGFGFEVDGALLNLETLKFYEALIALDHGGLLADFRAATERRVVWEIGAGWGGFAYQFKTLFPNVTYVISDLPELFLFSAVYLTEAFPDARVAFHSETATSWETWQEADFVFVPATRADAVRPGRLDLTIDLVSFQQMREDQVRRYAGAAAGLGCPHIYSLNRDRSPYNPEIDTVRAALAEHYWLHEIPLGPVGPRGKTQRPVSDLAYHHVIGWRRSPGSKR